MEHTHVRRNAQLLTVCNSNFSSVANCHPAADGFGVGQAATSFRAWARRRNFDPELIVALGVLKEVLAKFRIVGAIGVPATEFRSRSISRICVSSCSTVASGLNWKVRVVLGNWESATVIGISGITNR